MNIVFIDADYDANHMIADVLIKEAAPLLKGQRYGTLHLWDRKEYAMTLEILGYADVIVVLSPVSQTGLPSHLLAWMSEVELRIRQKQCRVSVLLYDELFRDDRLRAGVSTCRLWAKACGFTWIKGIGIGSMDASGVHIPDTKKALADVMKYDDPAEDQVVMLGNRIFAMMNVQKKWSKIAKSNGLERTDLHHKLDVNIFNKN